MVFQDKFLGIAITQVTRRRIENFKANRRGFFSLWLFLILFIASLGAELIANDKPLVVHFDNGFYFPAFKSYPETVFGGEFKTEADYRDPFLDDLINDNGWMIWPPIHFSYDTINYDLPVPSPAPPSSENWLGTDDQGRDVAARLIYGFRISILFGLTLTIFSSIVGIAAGAIQGYFGGLTDLLFQRFIEIWSGLPVLFLLIILASITEPNFWWLLGLMLLFNWMTLEGVVRAEFLRARNFEYVRAARALGVSDTMIMFRHILPNAMSPIIVATTLSIGNIILFESVLSFLGLGIQPPVASWGNMLTNAQELIWSAPGLAVWPGLLIFATVIAFNFLGDGLQDALDPRAVD